MPDMFGHLWCGAVDGFAVVPLLGVAGVFDDDPPCVAAMAPPPPAAMANAAAVSASVRLRRAIRTSLVGIGLNESSCA